MAAYIPARNDVVWLDFEPTKGKEIGKYRPALVLSSRQYNQQTGLLICCPISTSIRGGPTEVALGNLKGTLEKDSVVAASLIQTLSWKERKAKRITYADAGVMEQVLVRLLPLIGADSIIDKFIE
ncbi:type II toxin-antitoxin system PemK/MazF family toxin [Limnobacter humi]|uniref:Type II toxin-antitoxin system PemK/MazF family toxin n=1 Tax=Limnobacter humi TaxID=1778671 RepID=A0ABT1WJJ4_9BURK|nr:type II toxin-antitoxin system PemK/MazF family toxin [Limnobacter humi]MCQ8897690.1 type II toxin-antitoxin system PemK/MazF family toxin [Limnobacter humi]